MPHQIRPEVRQCIDTCMECHTVCSETVTHCLEMGGEHAKADHIGLLRDCVVMCLTSAQFMLGISPFQAKACGLCAEICERCAQDCERVGGNDELMRRCADICRRCAEACRKMAMATV